MLRTASELKGIGIAARDGDIGSVTDLYFDDVTWTIRYLVVDTGTWLPGRQVLVSPMAVTGEASADRIPVALTRQQVEQSPPVERVVDSQPHTPVVERRHASVQEEEDRVGARREMKPGRKARRQD